VFASFTTHPLESCQNGVVPRGTADGGQVVILVIRQLAMQQLHRYRGFAPLGQVHPPKAALSDLLLEAEVCICDLRTQRQGVNMRNSGFKIQSKTNGSYVKGNAASTMVWRHHKGVSKIFRGKSDKRTT